MMAMLIAVLICVYDCCKGNEVCMRKFFVSCCLCFVTSLSFASTVLENPQVGQIEMGFSPEGSAEQLVLKVINASQTTIHMMAYGFTSRNIAKALIQAKRRGVNVFVAADASNLKNAAGKAALSTLVTAGIAVRIVDKYRILHDKVIIADKKHVELGSFNYSKSAATSNSENAMILWFAPEVATTYLQHWQSRWDAGKKMMTDF